MVQDGPAAAGSTAAVGSEGGESCLICGQDLEQPNNDRAPLLAGARGWDLKKLSCGHRYHRACVVALYNYGIKAPCPRCYVPPADQADQQFDAAIRCRVRAHMAMEEQSNADLHTEADRLLRGALKGHGGPVWRGLVAGIAGLGRIRADPSYGPPERTASLGDLMHAMAWNPMDLLGRRVVVRPLDETVPPPRLDVVRS